MRYEEDMEILLPEDTKQCRNVLEEKDLGRPDTIYPQYLETHHPDRKHTVQSPAAQLFFLLLQAAQPLQTFFLYEKFS